MRILLVTACALLITSAAAPQAQQSQQPGAAQQGGRGGRGGRGVQPGLEPRIVSFEARPATVRPGETVLLVWQTANPAGGVTIDPEVGPVPPRGTKQLTLQATTTYTLSVGNGVSRTITVSVQGTAAGSVATSPVTQKPAGIRRFPDGRPDLTGVYANAGLPAGATPPALKPGAEQFRIVRGGPDDREVRGRTTLTTGNDCKPLGIPQTYITPYPFQLVQTPTLLLMIFEYPNAIRWIPIDGRSHEVDPDPTWMGSSVGRWDGDTLVVDAIGFNDKTEVHGFMHTEALHVVERFRRLESGDLHYDVTVEDPNVWQGPWQIPTRTFRLRPELENVSEFVCEATTDYQRLFKK